MDNNECIRCKRKLIINLNFTYRYVCSNECLKSLNKCAPKCKYHKCSNKTIFLNKKGRYATYCSLTCRKFNSEGLDKCLACNKETMKSLKSGEYYSFCSMKCRIKNSPKCIHCNNLVNYDRVNKKFFIMCPECYIIKNTQIINKNCDVYVQDTIINDGKIFENNNQMNVNNITTQSSLNILSLHECQTPISNVITSNEHQISISKVSPSMDFNNSYINKDLTYHDSPILNTKKYYHFFANDQLSDNSKYYQKCCYIYCPNMLEVNEHTDVFFNYCQDCKKSKNYQYDS